MADLSANQIPVYAITPKTAMGTGTALTAGTLGSNTNAVTVMTASASGSRVYSLIATTDDTVAVNLYIFIQTSGGTVQPIAQVNVPLRSGDTASTKAIDCLDSTVAVGLPIDNNGKRYIELANGDLLRYATVANMTAAKKIYVTAQYADYV